MRANVVVVVICEFLLISNTAVAQKDSVEQLDGSRGPNRAWLVPIAVVASSALDPELREWTLEQHGRSPDRLAKLVNPLGSARRLVPAMALTYVGASLTRRESLASGTLNTAAAYVAADLAESALKPIIGREQLRRACCLGQDLRRSALDERCDRDDCAQLCRQQCYHPVA